MSRPKLTPAILKQLKRRFFVEQPAAIRKAELESRKRPSSKALMEKRDRAYHQAMAEKFGQKSMAAPCVVSTETGTGADSCYAEQK